MCGNSWSFKNNTDPAPPPLKSINTICKSLGEKEIARDKSNVVINSLFPLPVVPAINPCGPSLHSCKSKYIGC